MGGDGGSFGGGGRVAGAAAIVVVVGSDGAVASEATPKSQAQAKPHLSRTTPTSTSCCRKQQAEGMTAAGVSAVIEIITMVESLPIHGSHGRTYNWQ